MVAESVAAKIFKIGSEITALLFGVTHQKPTFYEYINYKNMQQE